MTKVIPGVGFVGERPAPGKAGEKHDAGKARVGLMVTDFADALMEAADVSTYGADKYTARGWRTVPNGIERYTDALYRHLLAHAGGELLDQESGLAHLSHAAWNCLAILQLRMDCDGLIPDFAPEYTERTTP